MGVLWVVGVLATLYVSTTYVHGWAYMMEGDCPNNYRPGDAWHQADCTRCECHPGAYACYGCGVTAVADNRKCYLEFPYKNETYPKCCDVRQMCPGDRGYDVIHLKHGALIG